MRDLAGHAADAAGTVAHYLVRMLAVVLLGAVLSACARPDDMFAVHSEPNNAIAFDVATIEINNRSIAPDRNVGLTGGHFLAEPQDVQDQFAEVIEQRIRTTAVPSGESGSLVFYLDEVILETYLPRGTNIPFIGMAIALQESRTRGRITGSIEQLDELGRVVQQADFRVNEELVGPALGGSQLQEHLSSIADATLDGLEAEITSLSRRYFSDIVMPLN